MKLNELAAAVETEKGKLPAAAKKAARRKAVEDLHKGNAKIGGRIAGKPKKDRAALKAARSAAQEARRAERVAERQAERNP